MPLPEAVDSCRHEWAREALRMWSQSQGWPLPPAPELAVAAAPPEA
jgi:hypothetical protein